MANNVFHEREQRKPIFYSCPTPSNPPTPSLPSTSRPPLSHIQGQATIDDDDEYFNSIPPGHKFVPTDYELIVYYLEKKLQNLPLPRNKITEVNLYDHHPQDLAEQYKNRNQQQYWYFFTPRDRKYKNGTRPNRAAGNGYWKATGADREVRHNGHVLGLRKSLVYYVGKPPKGEKTNWIMHEFRMKDPPKPTGSNNMKLDDWVLCRIEHKNEKRGKNQREDSVSNEDDADMNENNLMVTPVADHSSLVNQYDCSLINYSNPFPNGFNPAFNDDNNVEDVSSQHESMHLNTTTQESFNPAFNDGNNVENVSSQHESNSNDGNDVLYTGIFDDIDPSSFTLPDKFN